MLASQDLAVYNQILPGTQEPGFSSIYRKKGVTKLIATPSQDLKSVADILHLCKKNFGNKRGLGQIIVTVEKGKNGEEIEKRTVKEYTYDWLYDTAQSLGKALVNRKLAFKQEVYGLNVLGIYSRNRLEWFLADWACTLSGYVLAPLYDSLGKEHLAHCINITGTTTLFISSQTAQEIVKFHQKGTLKHLILLEKISEDLANKLKALGLILLDLWQLIEQGKKLNTPQEKLVIKTQDVFSFCFTSGTTGPPKASMITHANMLAGLVPFVQHSDIKFSSNDVHLSYLPLPHLMERCVATTLFFAGAFLVISSGDLLKIRDDAAAAQVTLFLSVPRIYNRVVDGVKTLLDQMVTDESKRPHIQKAVFEKVKLSFGGKVRLTLTGSAPMNPAVHQLMQRMMECPMIQGYGQTQSPCGTIFSRSTKSKFSTMHELSAAIQVRLADIPEMKYTAKDKDSQGNSTPRGEILVRGYQVFAGYYKMEDLTKQTLDSDGWLRTGDVGQITPQLGFKIIDRKKNIFKLQQGEYIAPDRVEAYYLRSELVEEIFLHGTSNQNFAVAIATPRRDKLAQIGAKLGAKGSFEELCQNPIVRTAFLSQLNSYAKKNGLLGFEVAKNIYLETVGFASKKILTNTQKLIRYEARVCYSQQIDAMYSEGELKI